MKTITICICVGVLLGLIACDEDPVLDAPIVDGADPSWHWENPLPQPHFLFGAWGASSDDVYAVGDAGGSLLRWGQ